MSQIASDNIANSSLIANLPVNFKFGQSKSGKLVLISSNFIPKDTKIELLNGNLSDYLGPVSEFSLEVIDNENEIKSWFEIENYPKWLNYVNQYSNIEKCNLSALYSNNQVRNR